MREKTKHTKRGKDTEAVKLLKYLEKTADRLHKKYPDTFGHYLVGLIRAELSERNVGSTITLQELKKRLKSNDRQK
jgi:hypothetical protein